jgi:hypothetical protein
MQRLTSEPDPKHTASIASRLSPWEGHDDGVHVEIQRMRTDGRRLATRRLSVSTLERAQPCLVGMHAPPERIGAVLAWRYLNNGEALYM